MIVSLIIVVVLCTVFMVHHHYLPPIPKRKQKTYPYAILLGCPSHDDGTMATSQIKRCDLAIEAYQKHLFKTLIISGGAVKNQYYESKEMEKYILKKTEIPIICETQARNTFENFKNTKAIIHESPVLILTGSLHARRSCAIAKQFFNEYAAYTYTDRKPRHILREIISRCIYIKIEYQKKKDKVS